MIQDFGTSSGLVVSQALEGHESRFASSVVHFPPLLNGNNAVQFSVQNQDRALDSADPANIVELHGHQMVNSRNG